MLLSKTDKNKGLKFPNNIIKTELVHVLGTFLTQQPVCDQNWIPDTVLIQKTGNFKINIFTNLFVAGHRVGYFLTIPYPSLSKAVEACYF